MSSSIPDSISKDELLRLQVNAEPDFVPDETCEECLNTEIVIAAIDSAAKQINNIGAYALTADYSIWTLIQYHKAGYERFKEAGNIEQAAAWFSDLQLLEFLKDSLSNIEINCPDSPED